MFRQGGSVVALLLVFRYFVLGSCLSWVDMHLFLLRCGLVILVLLARRQLS